VLTALRLAASAVALIFGLVPAAALSSPSSFAILSLTYTDARQVWVLGLPCTDQPTCSRLVVRGSTDGGYTWAGGHPVPAVPSFMGKGQSHPYVSKHPSAGLAQRSSRGDRAVGATWLQLHPGSAPSPRAGESMAYDPARHRIVLFGGVGAAPQGMLHDTWVWDGRMWTQEHPSVSPPACAFAGMAYDGATRQIVLFGGAGANTGALDDTWTWNGRTWRRERPTVSPPARSELSMAYDAATKSVVLFGGSSPRGMAEPKLYNDTWTWDGRTWTEQKPTLSPPARSQAAMAYDAVTGRVTLFGGATGRQLADTWTWNGRAWAKQHPITTPPARASAGVAYDAHLRRVVLFAGVNIQGLTDTWTWNGATWAKVQVAASPPTGWNTVMAYDGRNRAVVLLLEAVSKRVRHPQPVRPRASAQMWMLDLPSINLFSGAIREHALEHPTRQEITRRLRVWWVDPTDHAKWPVRFLVSRGPYTVPDGHGGALNRGQRRGMLRRRHRAGAVLLAQPDIHRYGLKASHR
jgi:hypothetical protein